MTIKGFNRILYFFHFSKQTVSYTLGKGFLFILSLFFCGKVNAQDATSYARYVTKELCDKKYHGRGYVQSGVNKAGDWLKNELKKLRVRPVKRQRQQSYSFPVITQMDGMICELDRRPLRVGRDYLIESGSPSVKGRFVLRHFNAKDSIDMVLLRKKCKSKALSYEAYVIHHTSKRKCAWLDSLPLSCLPSLIIFTEDKKITHSVSTELDAYPSLIIFDSLINGKDSVRVQFESRLQNHFECENILGYIKGKRKDSCIVLTAHYDHLGMQGEAMFPGASDNASGVSMVLNLAKYFKKHKPKYNIYIILFSGEEAGLLGSRYFVEDPAFNLKRIKLLINLDIMGNVENGVTVVNGELHKNYFNQLISINSSGNYIKEVKIRGKAANSDHYPFSQKGHPAIFIYSLGGQGYYHDIDDTYEHLGFDHYEELYQLLVHFVYHL